MDARLGGDVVKVWQLFVIRCLVIFGSVVVLASLEGLINGGAR